MNFKMYLLRGIYILKEVGNLALLSSLLSLFLLSTTAHSVTIMCQALCQLLAVHWGLKQFYLKLEELRPDKEADHKPTGPC